MGTWTSIFDEGPYRAYAVLPVAVPTTVVVNKNQESKKEILALITKKTRMKYQE